MSFGLGPVSNRVSQGRYGSRVTLIGLDWLAALESGGQLVGMRQDLVNSNSTGHRHHLRNFSRARMAWTMTIAVMP